MYVFCCILIVRNGLSSLHISCAFPVDAQSDVLNNTFFSFQLRRYEVEYEEAKRKTKEALHPLKLELAEINDSVRNNTFH